ncbi:MAG: peptidase [Rhodospirillales bacterium]|nr:peptidase [Rhodospirillales bacterium]
MTYCVALRLTEGLVFLADTRTNAGVDRIATFCKMKVIEHPGERVIVLMTAGNLAITQGVMNRLQEEIELDGEAWTLRTVPDLYRAARLVGAALRTVYAADGAALAAHEISFEASIAIGGQIQGERMRLFQVYAAGNFIEATDDTPFFQLGEHKYGKPILDRVVTKDTTIDEAIKLALISMDSTLRSNLSVGLPLDLVIYRNDELQVGLRRRIDSDDPGFRAIRERWGSALRDAFKSLPQPDWK